MKVLLTGAAARLARPLLPRLLALPEVETVTGVDRRSSGFVHPRYRERRMDILDPGLPTLVAAHDALIHMAFVVMRSQLGRHARDRERMRRINVDGSLRALEAAGEAGLAVAIHISSASVYGAWPDQLERLDEDTPLRGIPGFAYAEDKVAVEGGLATLARCHPQTRFVSLRPHVILGRHAHPYLKRLLTAPLTGWLPQPAPRLQCVWEDDVAEAICLALIQTTAQGPFNLATEPPTDLPELRRVLGTKGIALPLSWLGALHRLAWWITPRAEDPGWLAGARHDLILDCRRARETLHWRPRRDTFQCVETIREQHS